MLSIGLHFINIISSTVNKLNLIEHQSLVLLLENILILKNNLKKKDGHIYKWMKAFELFEALQMDLWNQRSTYWSTETLLRRLHVFGTFVQSTSYPSENYTFPSAGLMLGQRRRRKPNIKPA